MEDPEILVAVMVATGLVVRTVEVAVVRSVEVPLVEVSVVVSYKVWVAVLVPCVVVAW